MVKQSSDSKEEQLPLNFGKRLAHTDKSVRDRGFKVLKKWLQSRTDLDRLECMKLWKGLYFCMWMADKRPVQQELCVNIALLLNDVTSEQQGVWLDAFWETMQTGWEKLDKHRMSKYMLFTRIVVAEAFKVLRVAKWPVERARAMGDTFASGCTNKRKEHAKRESVAKSTSVQSLGFLLQFVRVFWEEVNAQLEQTVETPSAALLQLVEPFCMLAEESPLRNCVSRVHEYVLRKAPRAMTKALAERLLVGAARGDIFKSNREALYETADALEREMGRHPTEKTAALIVPADAVASPRVLGNSATHPESKKRKREMRATETDEAPEKPARKAKGITKKKRRLA